MKTVIGIVIVLGSINALAEAYRIDRSNLKSVEYSVEATGVHSPICGQVEYRHHVRIETTKGAVIRLDREEHGCESFSFEEPSVLAKIKGGFVGTDDQGAYEDVYFVVTDSTNLIQSGSIERQYLKQNCSQ